MAEGEGATAGPGASPGVDALRGVFVVGVARSGTSLLKALLDGHPELWVPPAESFAVDWCGEADPAAAFLGLPKYAALFPEGSAERETVAAALREHLTPGAGVADAVLAFLHAMAAVAPPPAGARAWVEKTPKHLRSLPQLVDALGPETRAVCVVRDPRAVLGSQAKRWDRGRTPEGMRHFCKRWATGDVLVRGFERSLPQALAVRYEDLVDDPGPVMRRVAEHLGITWDDGLLVPTRGGEAWGGNSSYGRDPAQDATIATTSRERYRDELPAEIVAGVEALLGPRMASWGYAAGRPAAGPGRWWMELGARRAARRTLAAR